MQLEVYEAAIYNDGKPEVREEAPAEQKVDFPKMDLVLFFWLILFAFGGGLLALYYAEIDYFPDFTWEDALTHLALMAITGASLLVAFSFLLLAPGAIWSEFLVFDPHLHNGLTHEGHARPRERSRKPLREPCVLSISTRIIAPFFLFLAFCHALLVLADELIPADHHRGMFFVPLGVVSSLAALSALLWWDFKVDLYGEAKAEESNPAEAQPEKQRAWPPAPSVSRLFIAGLAHALVFLGFLLPGYHLFPWGLAATPILSFAGLILAPPDQPATSTSPLRKSTFQSLLCRYLVAFLCGTLLSLISVLFFHRIQGADAPRSTLVICTVVVVLANLVVSVLFHRYRAQALLASFLASLVLLGAGYFLRGGAKLPGQIMGEFGFREQSATLVVTELGGRLLKQVFEQSAPLQSGSEAQGGSPQQETLSEPSGEEAKGNEAAGDGGKETGKPVRLAKIRGVTILSRLGSDFVLSCGGRTVALPKDQVLTWSQEPRERGKDDHSAEKKERLPAGEKGKASKVDKQPPECKVEEELAFYGLAGDRPGSNPS